MHFHAVVMGNTLPSYVDKYVGAEVRESVAECIEANLGHWHKVDGPPQYGDVLVFNLLGLPVHTGVYIGSGRFLHAHKGTNSCIERLDSITWNKRLRQVVRWQKN